MRRLSLAAALPAIAACALLGSACYRVTVVTAAAPSQTIVEKKWVNSFVAGIVPPSAPINVAQQCPAGVQKVTTERSFLNGLVASITYNIYTPFQVVVTCAGR